MRPPEDRPRSWRQEPPKSPQEAATSELLQTLRSEPTLSLEALARVERRVRQDALQHPAGAPGGFRIAMLATAGGTVLAAFVVAIFAYDHRPTPQRTELARGIAPAADSARQSEAAASDRAEDKRAAPEAFAAADVPPDEPSATPRGLAPNARAGAGAGAFPMGAKSSAKKLGAPSAAQTRPAGLAMGSGAANISPAAAPAAAPPNALAKAEAADGLVAPDDRSTVLQAERLAASGRCTEAIPLFTRVFSDSDDSTQVEQALFGRARCYRALGQQSEASDDLQLYLSRYPHGRFAAQAEALLR